MFEHWLKEPSAIVRACVDIQACVDINKISAGVSSITAVAVNACRKGTVESECFTALECIVQLVVSIAYNCHIDLIKAIESKMQKNLSFCEFSMLIKLLLKIVFFFDIIHNIFI